MEVKDQCKGCSQTVIVPEEEIEKLLESAMNKGKATVNTEVYQKRVGTCMRCPSLLYGTTCKHCGCLVKYKALFIDKDCPHPDGSNW